MRSFIGAMGFLVLSATTVTAQLLGDPNAKADGEQTDKPVPGRPGAQAGRDADKRPVIGATAAPQANAMFAVMDADSDGVISKTELRKAIKTLKTLDTDNDGSITLAEASVGAPAGPAGPVGDDPQIAQLMAMDRNRDGKLTVNEVPVEMRQNFQGVDQNNDGITRQELAAAMANMRNQFGAGAWPGGPRGPNGTGLNDAEQAMGQFLKFDKDGDGRLSANELPPQAKRMMQADKNNDGKLDAAEMQAALAQQGGKTRALRGGIDPDAPRGRKN